jgi:hypothetical protein
VSVVHLPQAFGVVRPQSSPELRPVQSESTLQLPATQLPAVSQTYDVVPAPYAVVQFALSAGLLHGKQAPLTQRPAVVPVVHLVSAPVHAGAASVGESTRASVPVSVPVSAPVPVSPPASLPVSPPAPVSAPVSGAPVSAGSESSPESAIAESPPESSAV